MASKPRLTASVVRFFRGSNLLCISQHDGETELCDLAEDQGVEIPTNCTSGNCGTCMVRLVSGTVALPEELPPGLDEDIVELGARLACIGIPSGDVDIDVLPPL